MVGVFSRNHKRRKKQRGVGERESEVKRVKKEKGERCKGEQKEKEKRRKGGEEVKGEQRKDVHKKGMRT